MFFARFVALLSLLPLAFSQDVDLDTVKEAFQEANIPADLSITFEPSAVLQVSLPQTEGPPIAVTAGVQLFRNATAGPASYSAVGLTSSGPFVVISVDPDAPSPEAPTNAQIRHFLGGNFAISSAYGTSLVNSTPAVSEYRQPNPPTGAHRYIFLLYNQGPEFNEQTLINATSPINLFNVSAFAEATGLGDPIAGTFFRVRPDAEL